MLDKKNTLVTLMGLATAASCGTTIPRTGGVGRQGPGFDDDASTTLEYKKLGPQHTQLFKSLAEKPQTP